MANVRRACPRRNPDYSAPMTRLAPLILLACLLLLVALGASGCRTKKSGSQEFIPGQGWTPTR